MRETEPGDVVFTEDEGPALHGRFDALEASFAHLEQGGSFAATGALSVSLPTVAIAGTGVLSFPLRPEQLAELIAAASRAPFGRGDATLRDDMVRRTWQISADSLHFLDHDWDAIAMPTITAEAARALGVDGPVSANLYKLLIYEPGDFFVAHRDTEKEPGMFATLVVALPSVHTGGELVIEHQGDRLTADLSTVSLSRLSWAAFYTDCVHRLEPVRTGHRVCLVYNLVCDEPLSAPDPRGTRTTAAQALKALAATYTRGDPLKVVRVLDHHYTPAALSFAALKGRDASIVEALKCAADDASWECLLGMVSVSEHGAAEGEWSGSYRDRRWASNTPQNWQIVEVTERTFRVEDLMTPSGDAWTTPWLPLETDELTPWDTLADEPFDEEHFSEATGNEGASFERTYRRAAVVMWPRALDWEVLGQLPEDLVAPTLKAKVRAGDPVAIAFAPDWLEGAAKRSRHRHERDTLAFALDAAGSVYPPLRAAARDYLVIVHGPAEGAHGRIIDENEVAGVAAVITALGPEMAAPLLRDIVTHHLGTPSPGAWVSIALLFCRLCAESPTIAIAAGPFVARALPTAPLTARSQTPLVKMTEALLTGVAALEAAGDVHVGMAIGRHIEKHFGTFTIDLVLMPVIRRILDSGQSTHGATVRRVAAHVEDTLRATLGEAPVPPPNAAQDATSIQCKCKYCRDVVAFLQSPNTRVHHVKTAQAGRMHVMSHLRGVDVDTAELRVGSPHTLVITKNTASFLRALAAWQERRDLIDDIAQLSMPGS